MRNSIRFISAALALACSALIFGCATASAPGAVTNGQQFWANAVDDALSIGLTPVLTKNAAYVPAALALADAVGALTGDAVTSDDVDGVIASVKRKGYSFSPDDEKVIKATINAAWARFAKNYQAAATASIRPDVKLFASAAADGIRNAASAALSGS